MNVGISKKRRGLSAGRSISVIEQGHQKLSVKLRAHMTKGIFSITRPGVPYYLLSCSKRRPRCSKAKQTATKESHGRFGWFRAGGRSVKVSCGKACGDRTPQAWVPASHATSNAYSSCNSTLETRDDYPIHFKSLRPKKIPPNNSRPGVPKLKNIKKEPTASAPSHILILHIQTRPKKN